VVLQKELLRLAESREEYMVVADDIIRLRDSKQVALAQEADRMSKRQRVEEMTEFLDGQTGMVLRYEEGLTRRLVERVTVSEGRVVVGFRTGMEVQITFH
jgi:site-specific DNA recombinase